MLAFTLLVCLQVIVLFSVAHIAFRMPLDRAPVALVLLTVILGLVAGATGMLVAGFAKSVKQADNVGTILGFVRLHSQAQRWFVDSMCAGILVYDRGLVAGTGVPARLRISRTRVAFHEWARLVCCYSPRNVFNHSRSAARSGARLFGSG